MKKNIQKKTDTFFENFKNDIKSKSNYSKEEMIQFIYDYPTIRFEDDDFKKRKRVKNSIPLCNRCMAIKSTNTQCTRRKKDGFEFCGTHIKSTPHGVVNSVNKSTIKKIVTFAVDIAGIISYIDNENNVYDPQDIHENIDNPKVISKCIKNLDGSYSLVD